MIGREDELTGLQNADQFKNQVEQYMANSSVASPYAMLILDVVNFKQVNEQFGHIFGDNVLVQVADTIIDNIRSNDYAGRLGGDEFVIFLKNVSENAVYNMCDRFCREVSNIYVGENIKIDANIGAVVSCNPAVKYMDLLQTADIALGYLSNENKGRVKILREISEFSNHVSFSEIFGTEFRNALVSKEKRLSELVFELLEQAKDIDKAILAVLALVGEKRKVSSINVMTYVGEGFEPSYRWGTRGTHIPEKINGEVVRRFIMSGKGKAGEPGMGIISPETIADLTDEEKACLLPRDAKSVVYSEIMEFGEYTGVVTFVDCTGTRVWKDKDLKAFKTVSRMIGAFTLKAKAIKK